MTKSTSDKKYNDYSAIPTHDQCNGKPPESLILSYFDDGYTPAEIARLFKMPLDIVLRIVAKAVVRA